MRIFCARNVLLKFSAVHIRDILKYIQIFYVSNWGFSFEKNSILVWYSRTIQTIYFTGIEYNLFAEIIVIHFNRGTRTTPARPLKTPFPVYQTFNNNIAREIKKKKKQSF